MWLAYVMVATIRHRRRLERVSHRRGSLAPIDRHGENCMKATCCWRRDAQQGRARHGSWCNQPDRAEMIIESLLADHLIIDVNGMLQLPL